MKKIYSVVAVAAAIILHAQVGLVGVNTNNPTSTLDVNGTTRVRNLLPNTFNPTVDKIVVADANGVLKSVPESAISSAPSYKVLFDLSTITSINMSDSDPNGDNTRTPYTIETQTINLEKDALVQINYSVPVSSVFRYTGSTAAPVNDGKAKMLRTHLLVDNNVVTKSTNTYTSAAIGTGTGSDPDTMKGIFYNTGSFFIKLAAGPHTIKLEGTCNPYIICTQGGSASGTRFQAIALY